MIRFPSFSENESTFTSNVTLSDSFLHKTYSEKNEKRLTSGDSPYAQAKGPWSLNRTIGRGDPTGSPARKDRELANCLPTNDT